MSGPKHSDVRLLEEQRRKLEEERKRKLEEERIRQEEMKMQEIDVNIQELHSQLMAIKEQLETFARNELEEANLLFSEKPIINRLQGTKEQSTTVISDFPKKYKERKLSIVQSYRQQLASLVKQSEVLLAGELGTLLTQLKQEIRQKKIANAEEEFIGKSKELQISRRKINLSLPMSKEEEAVEAQADEAWKVFQERIQPYLESHYIKTKHEIHAFYQATKAIFESNQFEDAYKKLQLEQRTKLFISTSLKYDREMEISQRLEKEYEWLTMTYRSLCQLVHQEYLVQPFSIEQAPSQIEKLKADIAVMEKQWSEQEESEYIVTSVNEVMTALGYEVIASDIMKTPKRSVVQQIYEFGENTAVNVSTSDNGSLLFQVHGVSEGRKEDITSREKVQVMEAMERFCGEYPLIKDELRKRGLQLVNEDLKPVEEKYVSFIDMTKKKKVNSRNSNKKVQKPKLQQRY